METHMSKIGSNRGELFLAQPIFEFVKFMFLKNGRKSAKFKAWNDSSGWEHRHNIYVNF